MKETKNASLASQSFVFEVDAYNALSAYLKDIEARLPQDDHETMADIESRIAEILQEKLTSSMMVLTLNQVREAMNQMGRPSDFGERREEAQDEAARLPRQLRRPIQNRSIAGVCAGVALYLGIDITLMRLATLILFLFGGLSFWVYVILWIVIPEEGRG